MVFVVVVTVMTMVRIVMLVEKCDLWHVRMDCGEDCDEGRGGRDGGLDVQRGELVVLGLLK